MTSNATAEALRGKHIRTLEALQKVVDENKQLKEQLSLLQTKSAGTNSDPNSSNAAAIKIERLQFENSQLASQLNDTNGTLLDLRRAHAQSEQQFHNAKVGFLKQINDLKTELGSSRKVEKELRLQIVDTEAQLEQQGSNRRDQLFTQNVELQKAAEEIAAQKKMILALEEELEELKAMKKTFAEVDELSNENSSLIEKVKELEARNGCLENNLTEKSGRLNDVERVNTTLEAELLSAKNFKSTEASSREEQLEKEVQVLKKANTSLENILIQKSQKESELEATVDELRAICKRYEEECAAAKKKTDAKPEVEEGMGKDFPAFVKLKRENAVLKTQLRDLMVTQRKMVGQAKRVTMGVGGSRRR